MTLGRMTFDGRHNTGLRFSLDEARLAAGLNDLGLSARLYTGKPEGRVVDVVRQLVRTRTDAYLFAISAESASAVLHLAHGIREIRSDAAFFFWSSGTELLPLQTKLEAIGRLARASSAEQMLQFLSEQAVLPGDKPIGTAQLSPYRSGLLPRDTVAVHGLWCKQSAEQLSGELRWLEAQNMPTDTTFPMIAYGMGEAELLELCQMLGESTLRGRFELCASSRSITQAVIDGMTMASVDRLRLEEEAGTLALNPTSYGVTLVNVDPGGKLAHARRMEYGRNGMIAVHSGMYPDGAAVPGIQHLELSVAVDSKEREAAYAWAEPNLLLRSAAMLEGPAALVIERLETLKPPFTEETSAWPKHTYAIAIEKQGKAQLVFDGDAESKQAMQYVALNELRGAAARPGQMTFVSMREAADLTEFERRLARFHRDGIVDAIRPGLPVLFENMCRWLTPGACQLTSLRRLQVHDSGRITACRDSGEVGSVGEAFDGLVTKLKQRRQMEEVRRECAVCPVREECSQCVHLPESWGGRYCEIRIAYPRTALFVVLTQFPQILAQYLQLKPDEIDLRISYTGLPAQHYKGVTGETRSGERPVLVSVADQHLSWWPGTPKLLRLSAPLATMAEAWWSGAGETDVIDRLSNDFQVTRETAATSLAEGWTKLRSQGIIHG